MQYWLMKSEPDAFSVDDLASAPNSPWDGVRNYQARNFIRDMRVGDAVLFYHSSCKVPGVVGIAEVTKAPYPDHTAHDPTSPYFDAKSSEANPRWSMVDVSLKEKLRNVVTLNEIKQAPNLSSMLLVSKGSRLSVMPVEQVHYEYIVGLGRG